SRTTHNSQRAPPYPSGTCARSPAMPREPSLHSSSRVCPRDGPDPRKIPVTERQIRIFGDPVLKTASDPIDAIDDGVRGLVDDLLDSVRPPGRAGVAASQIGVNLRAFSYNIDGDIGYILNPVIVETQGDKEPDDEGRAE